VGRAEARIERPDVDDPSPTAFGHRGGRRLGEQEAGHDEGHDPDAGPIKIGDLLGCVGLVGQAQHRRRMGVVDEFVRQKGVQQGLDRRVGRARIEQVGALDAHHLLVRQRVARAQFAQRRDGRLGIESRYRVARQRRNPACGFDPSSYIHRKHWCHC